MTTTETKTVMTPAQAIARPDAWKAMHAGKKSTRPWRVGRLVNGSIEWHRGGTRYPAQRMGPIITFGDIGHAMARAGALNIADAEATGWRP